MSMLRTHGTTHPCSMTYSLGTTVTALLLTAEVLQIFLFTTTFRSTLGLKQPHSQNQMGFWTDKMRQSMKLTTHIHLVQKWKKC